MTDRSSSSSSSSPRGATLFVLVKGVIGMAQGKDITGQRSQAADAEAHPVPGDRDPARRRLLLVVASGS